MQSQLNCHSLWWFWINCHQLWHFHTSCISGFIQCISKCKNLLRSFPYLDPAGTFIHTWMHSSKYEVHAIPIEWHGIWHFKRIVIGCDIFTHHAFQDLYNASVIAKLTQIMSLSNSSRHIHSHMIAFTQKCITCNPNWIVTVYDILNHLSPVVTFSNMHFNTFTMHQALQKLTQIIQLSRDSWHFHSHLNAITQICITCNSNWMVTVYDISNNLSPVVTFSHLMHFRTYTMHQSLQKPTQIITLSHCSWHIHSHMNAFTQICITCRSKWIVTVYDILNRLSPVVTISHNLHFKNYAMLQSKQNLTHIMALYQSSWPIHSKMKAFTGIYITCNPNRIVTVSDISNKLSPVVTFAIIMHFMTYTMHQSMQKLTQIIPLSRASWHIYSHMYAFPQICITCNPNWIVTVYDF